MMSLNDLSIGKTYRSLLVPLLATTAATAMVSPVQAAETARPNILLLTADDMCYDSLGCTGNPLPGISPNLDRLAREGIVFEHCYNATPICGPSRNAIYTGMYPHCNGYMGHGVQPPTWWLRGGHQRPQASIISQLYDAGYFTGLIGKHGTAACKYSMPAAGNYQLTGMGRDPQKYYAYIKKFLANAKASGKPFFLAANAHDPHRYWAQHRSETPEWIDNEMKHKEFKAYANGKPYPDPQKNFKAKDCKLPPCYPDDIRFKDELKHYFGSVNRMDQVIGKVLKALEESGMADNTVVMFIGDHGLGWSMTKWTLYPTATRTPLIVRYPGKVKPGSVDSKSVLETVDIAPTIAKICQVKPLERVNGMSFDELLTDREAPWTRKAAFSCFNFMNNEPVYNRQIKTYDKDLFDRFDCYRPSRSLANCQFAYIWNAWSDGKRTLPRTMQGEDIYFMKRYAGKQEAKGFPDYAQRADFLLHHVPEEFYDVVKDPGCLHNLAGQPKYAETIRAYRAELLKVMEKTNDHELQNYRDFLLKH